MPRTKQRTPELREKILATALEALNEGGAPAFTTRRIAQGAGTSTPAVYELFGDRAGLVGAMFAAGFQRLAAEMRGAPVSGDPGRDLLACFIAYRSFVAASPALAQVMFSRPFVDFDPAPADLASGAEVRALVLGRVHRCLEAGIIAGDAEDIAHVLVSLAIGLASQERAGLLGSSRAARDRRWRLALEATLNGLAPTA